MSTDQIKCGAETTSGGECENPAGENGYCWIPTHNPDNDGAENPQGRPKAITEDKANSIYEAVKLGLTVKHQAAIAGVHPDTLRRAACCLETLREPELSADNPCDFCEGYVRAHGQGAMNVLDECKPEFRASATFGYTKKEKREMEHSGEIDGFNFEINAGDDS